MKLQNTSTKPKQDEVRGSEYILHEILGWKAQNPPVRQSKQYGLLRQNQLSYLDDGFYTLYCKMLCKVYFEPLMHDSYSYVGFVDVFCNLV